jgi:hypothetical protein
VSNVPFLQVGQKIINPDGTPVEWFRNGINALILRTGDETTDTVFNAVSGAAEAQATADAAAAAAAAASASAAASQATADAAATAAAAAASGTSGSPSFYATASRSVCFGTTPTSGSVTTPSVTVTPTGGTGPYTYAWTYDSGDVGFSANTASSASTTFTGSVAAGEDLVAVWRCTVTDSLAATCFVTVGVSISSLS